MHFVCTKPLTHVNKTKSNNKSIRPKMFQNSTKQNHSSCSPTQKSKFQGQRTWHASLPASYFPENSKSKLLIRRYDARSQWPLSVLGERPLPSGRSIRKCCLVFVFLFCFLNRCVVHNHKSSESAVMENKPHTATEITSQSLNNLSHDKTPRLRSMMRTTRLKDFSVLFSFVLITSWSWTPHVRKTCQGWMRTWEFCYNNI